MKPVRGDLPSGTVTFLFTDVEGSTKLLDQLGAERYAEALAAHRRVLRDAFAAHGGVEVDTQGDAFFYAFPTAPGALTAAAQACEGLSPGPIRVRMGIHTGTPHLAEEGYVGPDVHRAARIAAAGHGGQVLVSAATAHLLETSNTLLLADLGEHRLKDLSAPERIYQLGEEEFPPLGSLHQTNLPVPATPFLGRERELQEVTGLLAREDVRLLTLTGPGGTGKTRLGLQAAAEAAERYPHGVWWVPLAPLRDPRLVLETAAQTLGAKDGLTEHVADKSLLLLFDNFEHVVAAANELAELLAACPNLHLVVTSRELLRVPGEQAYPVPPLEPQDGAELFLTRARAAVPSFEPGAAVPELCARLENLPLALELAAARVRVLSPEQLLERLSQRLDLLKAGRGVDPRQQTLGATIEWSHDLLEAEEQRLFARLAVFAGGCTLDAAEEVAEADLDTLQSLVDKSLVRVREGDRFWMLETIREYAAEQLEKSSEAAELKRRHAEHFLTFAEEAEPHLRRDSAEWADRMAGEHDNLRAALDRIEASGESELALRLAGAASRFWYLKSHLAEGRRRLESALAADTRPTAARAKALNGAAVMAFHSGDTAAARLRAEGARALHRTLGDAWGVAYATMTIGNALAEEADLTGAQQLLAESVRLFVELGDELYVLIASSNLASVTGELGDLEGLRAVHEENLSRARKLGNERMEAGILGELSIFVRDEGRLQDAAEMLRAAIRIEHRLGNVVYLAIDLGRLASVLVRMDEAGQAARLLSSSEALTEDVGAGVPSWAARRNEETLTAIRAQLDATALAQASEEGRALTLDEAVALALDEAAEGASIE
jgi:predicted ATPase/class 3 adenylate cyclase